MDSVSRKRPFSTGLFFDWTVFDWSFFRLDSSGHFLYSQFVSRKRPFSTEAQIGLSYTVEKGLVRLNFSTEFSDQKLDFFYWICQSKNSVEKVLHLFFEPIASLIPPQNIHPHAHTPIPGTTQQYHTTALTLPWLSLLLLLAASQRGALLAPLASSMYHTTAAVARVIDAILPTTATPAVGLAALR